MSKRGARLATRMRLGASLACALLGLTSGAARAGDPVSLGVVAVQSGTFAAGDAAFIAGAKLAAANVNAAGGAAGHNFEIRVVDTAAYPPATDVILAARGASLRQATVPQIVAGSLPLDATWSFLVGPSHGQQLAVALDFAKTALHAQNIVVFYACAPSCMDEANTLERYKDVVHTAFALAEGNALPQTFDFAPLFERAETTSAAAVVDTLSGPVHVREAESAKAAGFTRPLVLANDSTSTLIDAARAYPNSYFVLTPVQAYPSLTDARLMAAVRVFLADYKRSKLDPAGVVGASLGWDAVRVLTEAVTRSGAVSGEALRAAIETVSVEGANGRYTYSAKDHTGQADAPNPLAIGRIDNGRLMIVAPMRPSHG